MGDHDFQFEAEQQLGFDYVELARDPLYYNMCRVERLAKQRAHKYPKAVASCLCWRQQVLHRQRRRKEREGG